MRVVTFNIKHGTGANGRVDVARLVRTCAGFGADILALQEVDRRARRSGWSDQVGRVARATGMSAAFGEAARRRPLHRYGNALFGRGRVGDVEVVALPRPEGGEPRVAIVAAVTVDVVSVSVAATHLSFRRGEAPAQLDAVIGLLDRRPPPRILLGDLNLGPARAEAALHAAGYDVAVTSPTFPARDPRQRIDYVAVSGLRLVRADASDCGISDHRAVVAEVDGPGPGQAGACSSSAGV